MSNPSDNGVWFLFSCQWISGGLCWIELKRFPQAVSLLDWAFLLITVSVKTASYGAIDETIVGWIFVGAVLAGHFLRFLENIPFVATTHTISFYLMWYLALVNEENVGSAGPDIIWTGADVAIWCVFAIYSVFWLVILRDDMKYMNYNSSDDSSDDSIDHKLEYVFPNFLFILLTASVKQHYYGSAPAVVVGWVLFSAFLPALFLAKEICFRRIINVICYATILQMCLVHNNENSKRTTIHMTKYHKHGVFVVPHEVYALRVSACGSAGAMPDTELYDESFSPLVAPGAWAEYTFITLPDQHHYVMIGDNEGVPSERGGFGKGTGNGGGASGLFLNANYTFPVVIAAGGGGTGYIIDDLTVRYYRGGAADAENTPYCPSGERGRPRGGGYLEGQNAVYRSWYTGGGGGGGGFVGGGAGGAGCGGAGGSSYVPSGGSRKLCFKKPYLKIEHITCRKAGNFYVDTSSWVCRKCPEGRWAAEGALECCEAGSYWNEFSCVQCPAHSYCTEAIQNSCTPGLGCPRSGAIVDSDCYYDCCNVGYYYSQELDRCTQCQAGHYCVNSMQNACPVNTYAGNVGAYFCRSCPPGSVSFGRASECCAKGYFVNDQNTCSLCPAGFYCMKGVQYICPANTFSNSKSTSCDNCPTNSVSFEGAAECIFDGYYVNSSGSIVICPAGSYCAKSVKHECPVGYPCAPVGSSELLECFDKCCAPGWYWDVGSASCFRCELGHFCDKSVMRLCPANEYSNTPSSVSCTSCPDGTVSAAGFGGCCAEGHYLPSNSTECRPCVNMTYSAGNQVKCCSRGQMYSSGTCLECPLGTSMPSGSSDCILCPIGSYSDVSGTTKCRTCDMFRSTTSTGSKSSRDCVNLAFNFVIGWVFVILVVVLVIRLLINGRFHCIAHCKQRILFNSFLIHAEAVHAYLDKFNPQNRIQRSRWHSASNALIVVTLPVVFVGFLLYHFVFSLLGVFFMALIMSRSMPSLPYIENVHLTLDVLDIALANIDVSFQKFTLVFYPFLVVYKYLQSLNLDYIFRSFYLDCGGVQGVSELFLNLLIIYWVVIAVEGGYNTYLSAVAKRFHLRLLFSPCTNDFSRYAGVTYKWLIAAKVGASMWSSFLLLEPYNGFTQYILGFLTLGKFVSSNGSRGTSGQCQIPNAPYMDDFLSYLSTIIALYLLNFGLYTLGKLLVQRKFNNKISYSGQLHFAMPQFSSVDDWLVRWSHNYQGILYSQIPNTLEIAPASQEELHASWEESSFHTLPPLSTLDDLRLRLYSLVWCPVYVLWQQPKVIHSVAQNYAMAFMTCFGVWTNWTVEKSNVIENINRFCDTNQHEHRDQIFCEALHAEVGYRLLLFQIIPHWSFTILSVFAVNTAGYPLFVSSATLLNALPPLFDFTRRSSNHEPGWLATPDFVYSFLEKSRGVHAIIRIYNFLCAIVLLFAPAHSALRAVSLGGLAMAAVLRATSSLLGFYLYVFDVSSVIDDSENDDQMLPQAAHTSPAGGSPDQSSHGSQSPTTDRMPIDMDTSGAENRPHIFPEQVTYTLASTGSSEDGNSDGENDDQMLPQAAHTSPAEAHLTRQVMAVRAQQLVECR